MRMTYVHVGWVSRIERGEVYWGGIGHLSGDSFKYLGKACEGDSVFQIEFPTLEDDSRFHVGMTCILCETELLNGDDCLICPFCNERFDVYVR